MRVKNEPGPKVEMAAMSRRSMMGGRFTERKLAQIACAIGQQGDFKSEEELNAFLQIAAQDDLSEDKAMLTPLQQAQELIYDAWEIEDARKQIQLAKHALRLSGDCADAYNILADFAKGDPWEAVRLYREGVAAGERAIGLDRIRKAIAEAESGKMASIGKAGKVAPKSSSPPFWVDLATRPYMRAKGGLAEALWRVGQWEEAIYHLQELLKLNPNDNQGVRFILLTWLVFMGEPEPVEELLQLFPDGCGAAWLYSSALWLFRKSGANPEASHRLRMAWASNRYVPDYLLQRKRFDVWNIPPAYSLGSEEEAQDYATYSFNVWWQIPGARSWLAREMARFSEPWLEGRPTKREMKVGRNDPCPCGSGKKYKKCCLAKGLSFDGPAINIPPHPQRWDIEIVRAMPTERIFATLSKMGIQVNEEDVRQGVHEYASAELLSESWIEKNHLTATGVDEDFPWFAAWALWERFNLRPVPSETISEMIEEDMRLCSEERNLGKYGADRFCSPDTWTRAWGYIKEHLRLHKCKSLEEASKMLDIGWHLDELFLSYILGLQLEEEEDPAWAPLIVREIREFRELVPLKQSSDPSELELSLNLTRVEGEALFCAGHEAEAEALFRRLTQEHPKWVWGYVGWADLYLGRKPQPSANDLQKALEICRLAVANGPIEDQDAIDERLEEIREASEKS